MKKISFYLLNIICFIGILPVYASTEKFSLIDTVIEAFCIWIGLSLFLAFREWNKERKEKQNSQTRDDYVQQTDDVQTDNYNDEPYDYSERKLETMGKTWFVVYHYYKNIDPKEKRWFCRTLDCRVSAYRNSRKYHEKYLRLVLDTPDGKLETNKLGISAYETKQMAKRLLGMH